MNDRSGFAEEGVALLILAGIIGIGYLLWRVL